MLSTNTAIQTALSGLQAYQAAIDTTGENITNENTAGYTRQRVTLTESAPLDISAVSRNTGQGAEVGTGVSIDGITRVRDQFLDTQYRSASTASAYDSEMSSQLGQVQSALDDSSTTGISSAITSFFSAVSAMADTDSSATQQNVLSTAGSLASTLNTVAGQISTVSADARSQLQQYMQAGGQVDQYAHQLSSLNTEIKNQVAAGQTPNTLLDQRDQIIDELAGLAQTTTVADANGDGGVSVSFAGQTLVDGTGAHTPLSYTSITMGSGGTLGALAELSPSGSTITGLLSQLDTVAGDVASSVNAVIGGAATPSGSNLFTTSDGSATVTAANITTGATAASTLAGSSITPSSLQGLYAQSTGLTGDYSAFVNSVGVAAQSASSASTTSTAVTAAVQSQRESVSGVSLDEEMANLVTYQQGYQASARVMNTQDEMISDLLSVVGGGL